MSCVMLSLINSSLIMTNMTGEYGGQASMKCKTFLEKYVRANAVFRLLIRREDVYTVLVINC